jgi:hypothetical protein
VHPREALLRAEYQPWYPGLRVDTWLPAELVAQVVRTQLNRGEPRWNPGPRVLGEDHFQFRGGQQKRSRLVRTRQGELSVQYPRLW